MKKRVVITGCGIISSLGNSYQDVIKSLREGKSGIRKVVEWEKFGLKSSVAGIIRHTEEKEKKANIPRRKRLCMSGASFYCVLAAHDALQNACLADNEIKNDDCGCFVGSGISDVFAIHDGANKLYDMKARRINPHSVAHAMSSSCSANVVNMFPVGGRSYSIGAACATSAHNIGHAFELIQNGILNTAIAGGGEDVNPILTAAFCAMRIALSTKYNDTPEKASRPYDVDRDGFVISGGAGIVILEELEHAKNRGATIYAEIVGFHANSDGYDIFLPDPKGTMTARCMKKAMGNADISPDSVDYINTHGTSTIVGDLAEINAIKKVFEKNIPYLSSTKSLGGHSLGAAGVHELIYCLGMMENDFIAASNNIESLDQEFVGIPIAQEVLSKELNIIISNNFGFGGTNATIVLRRNHD
ncbi:beta-ketoacyl synthase N-terminal-like domain-containing protein [Desulfobacula sp.]|uniref:beta-ketoacyl-[acyl-carrier-protein] synthase family protein n=1 Tax=Desulfobacula sp. TaxID=2593537 RepID=UPI002629DF85|nr:beta-ketoacyl synthase N-terminal-like domain-containing protein [Desulfobacula sp.]